MELSFLPQTNLKNRNKTALFHFQTYLPASNAELREYGGFYYVGNNHEHIAKLVKVYGRGYASDGLDNVRKELLRSLEQENNVLPEAIICEARFDYDAIHEFKLFLLKHPVLSSIPFVLDGCGLKDADLEMFKKNTRPDDIVFMDRCEDEMLRKKVAFLRRMKIAQKNNYSASIEENIPVSHLNEGFGSKRIFDILFAGIILLLVSPLFLLIALAIRIESRGPIFYISKRAGRGYKIFNFYKFRTMCLDADKKIAEMSHLNQYNGTGAGPVFFKVSNDPRITKVGSFLRNSSLDELPQLINVLLGDMSLVGNRPLPLYEAATLTTNEYAARFLAPAGITGLWQVKKRGTKEMSIEERINIDIDYAVRYSFATDLWIIANTPSALLQKENV